MRFLFVLLIFGLNTWAQNTFPFYKGEVLNYEINWGVIPAGTAQMRLDKNAAGDGYRLLALAKSKGYYEWAYKVRDTVTTWVNNELEPKAFGKVLHEGSWHNRQVVSFQNDVALLSDSVFTDFSPNGKLKRFSQDKVVLEDHTHTVTSAFYAFRTLDLIKGKSYEFNAVSGKKKYKLKVLVHGYEKITVDAGTFDCAIVEPLLDGDALFKSKGKMKIWISRDSRRLPVLVSSEISLGSISIELQNWTQGK